MLVTRIQHRYKVMIRVKLFAISVAIKLPGRFNNGRAREKFYDLSEDRLSGKKLTFIHGLFVVW
jgi:hypothetical protein